MTSTSTSTSILESFGFLGAEAAFKRASRNAHRIAAQTGTQLVFWRDGRLVFVDPDPDAFIPFPTVISPLPPLVPGPPDPVQRLP
jgi:hypothetical protein